MRTRERWAFLAAAVLLVVVLPGLNALPQGSPLRVSDFTLNLFGKFLTYAILALGIDLIWGYTGVLSLGHGVFFGLGAYAMGMHLMLEIGAKGVSKPNASNSNNATFASKTPPTTWNRTSRKVPVVCAIYRWSCGWRARLPVRLRSKP